MLSCTCLQVLVLENVRFHKEETKNDPEFAKQVAAHAHEACSRPQLSAFDL